MPVLKKGEQRPDSLEYGTSPAIYEDKIAYSTMVKIGENDYESHLFVYDISTSTEIGPIEISGLFVVDFYGDKILLRGGGPSGGSDYDIYVYDLTAPPPDFDSDGIEDTNDNCPTEAEDFDGYQDNDGCQDNDNDNDGILDINDECPMDQETINGYQDDDGCPDTPPTTKQSRKPKIVLLANSIDYEFAADFFGFLRNAEIEIIHVNAKEFDDYKTEKFIVILGGPDAYEGVGEIVQEVLADDEQEYLRENGNRKMYVKTNIWAQGQRVAVIAGSDRYQTKNSMSENKEGVVSESNTSS